MLEAGILGVDVGETAHSAGCALKPVVPFGYIVESVGVVEVVMPSGGIVQRGEHG